VSMLRMLVLSDSVPLDSKKVDQLTTATVSLSWP
jgi:hypothetical protein